MSQLTLISVGNYVGIHPFPREGANDKVAIWGALNGGNFSLKNKMVRSDKELAEAFSRLGAAPWPPPPSFKGKLHTTPHAGSNFYGTVLNVSLGEAVAFLEQNGYSFVGNAASPGQGVPKDEAGETRGVSLVEVLKALAEGAVESGYENLVACLRQAGRFCRIESTTALGVAAAWPTGFGVYVVRKANVESVLESILYIGMTGKITRREGVTVPGGTGFAGRINRYTPYCYTSDGPFCDYFEFGPKASGDGILNMPPEDRYEHRFPLSETVTDCFLLTGIEKEVSPSFLEAILLQLYFRQTETLPIGNNAF